MSQRPPRTAKPRTSATSYTIAEIEVLTDALRRGMTPTEAYHRLPSRSLSSVMNKMHELRQEGAECGIHYARGRRSTAHLDQTVHDRLAYAQVAEASAELRDRVRKYLGLRPWDRVAA